MDTAVLAGRKLYERARGYNSYNRADIHIAHFGVARNAHYYSLGALRVLNRSYAGDIASAAVVLVELYYGVGFLHYLLDYV